MKKIKFPLNMNMKRDTVADLHAALTFLNLEVAEEEIHDKRYGEKTATAVRRFQAKNGLRETSRVDEETAHVLNQILHDAGSLDDLDSYAVRGQIRDKSKSPIPGLLVRAVDRDPCGENSLGQPVVTDEDGRYAIIYYDHQFRIGGRKSGNADIVAQKYETNGITKTTFIILKCCPKFY